MVAESRRKRMVSVGFEKLPCGRRWRCREEEEMGRKKGADGWDRMLMREGGKEGEREALTSRERMVVRGTERCGMDWHGQKIKWAKSDLAHLLKYGFLVL